MLYREFTFGKYVFISILIKGGVKLPNSTPKSIRFLDKKREMRENGLFYQGRPVYRAPKSGMTSVQSILRTTNCRIAAVALLVVVLDQFTKLMVLRMLDLSHEKVVVEGFFKFVHWGNTGAAWSLFRGNNNILAAVALIALIVLYFSRHHFD